MKRVYVYDTYGLRTEDLEEAKSWVEKSLNISFEPHSSTYMGGLYYSVNTSDRGN
jgi:hypothetical protein